MLGGFVGQKTKTYRLAHGVFCLLLSRGSFEERQRRHRRWVLIVELQGFIVQLTSSAINRREEEEIQALLVMSENVWLVNKGQTTRSGQQTGDGNSVGPLDKGGVEMTVVLEDMAAGEGE